MAGTRIVAIEPQLVSLPFEMGGAYPRFAGQTWSQLDILLVRVQTEDGLVGWGEAFGHAAIPATRTALESIVAPLVLGRDASQITALSREVLHATHLLGRNGCFVYAWSGIEIALWDLLGKRAGLPLYALLGAAKPACLAAYASLLHYADLGELAHNVAAAAAAGFRAIKLHQSTREAVQVARDVLAGRDIALMLDLNCAWDVPEALAMAQTLQTNGGLHWLEEPVWPPEDARGLARVRAAVMSSGIPIAAGENTQGIHAFAEMMAAQAIDIAQPSVTKIGGVGAVVEIARLAQLHGLRVILHSPYFGPGFIASLHLNAALSPSSPVEVLWLAMQANPFMPWVQAREGELVVPDGPGLGCDPEPNILARYRVH